MREGLLLDNMRRRDQAVISQWQCVKQFNIFDEKCIVTYILVISYEYYINKYGKFNYFTISYVIFTI